MRGSRTLREVLEQPAAWSAALTRFEKDAGRVDRLFDERTPGEVVFTGCGSSYYLSMTAASAFQQITGLRARAVPASEVFQFPESVFAQDASPLLVAASRSGTTTETLRAVKAASRQGIPTLCLTCAARSPLARSTDLALCSPSGGERSV
jgi:glucosamine--fructose-6-phosphate aminotransferase (isomerizing)